MGTRGMVVAPQPLAVEAGVEILRRGGNAGDAALARLAVLHSKVKGASNVPVFLAEARYVSKFKGAKPGLVRISRYQTINVS